MSKAKQAVVADDEIALYERIRALVVTARQTVARGVDLVQVHTNFEIGRHIVEHEQQGEARAAYGKEVLAGGKEISDTVWAIASPGSGSRPGKLPDWSGSV